jgi:hypothetical protein
MRVGVGRLFDDVTTDEIRAARYKKMHSGLWFHLNVRPRCVKFWTIC